MFINQENRASLRYGVLLQSILDALSQMDENLELPEFDFPNMIPPVPTPKLEITNVKECSRKGDEFFMKADGTEDGVVSKKLKRNINYSDGGLLIGKLMQSPIQTVKVYIVALCVKFAQSNFFASSRLAKTCLAAVSVLSRNRYSCETINDLIKPL